MPAFLRASAILVAILLIAPAERVTFYGSAKAVGVSNGVMGDVTCDGAVGVGDAVALSRSAAGVLPNPGCMVLAADVTCDGGVDAVDVLRVLRSLAGFLDAPIEGCELVGDPIFPGLPSSVLIDAALEDEEITADEAAKYRVLAAYGAPGVPAELQGDELSTPSTLAVAEVYASWSSLSPQTQADLAPYMVPPIAESSWFTGDSNLRGLSDLVAHVVNVPGTPGIKLWTTPGFPSESLNSMMTMMSQVLTTSSSLMGRSPLDDTGLPDNGGDGALDVYVLPGIAAGAIAKWYEPNTCKGGPMFVEVSEDVLPQSLHHSSGGFAGALQRVSHAIIQATAGGVNTPAASCVFGQEFKWAVEATAALSEHLAYPDVNSEHRWDEVFDSAHTSIHALEEGGHSLWTLFDHIGRTDPAVVSELWAQAESSGSAHDALDTVTELAEAFPSYALELLNVEPYNHFTVNHGLIGKVTVNLGLNGTGIGNVINVALGGLANVKFNPALTALDDFSAQHYSYKVTDPAVKSLSFGNLIHNVVGTSFQALTKESGSSEWHLADLTMKALENVCLADIGNNISEVMLVMSHFDTDNLAPAPFLETPLVEAFDDCGFHGTGGVAEIYVNTPDYSAEFHGTITGLKYQLASIEQDGTRVYSLTGGSISWTVSGLYYGGGPECDLFDSSIHRITPIPRGSSTLRVKPVASGVEYSLTGFTNLKLTYFSQCGGPFATLVEREIGLWQCSDGVRTSEDPTHLADGVVVQPPSDCPGVGAPPLFGSHAWSFGWDLRR